MAAAYPPIQDRCSDRHLAAKEGVQIAILVGTDQATKGQEVRTGLLVGQSYQGREDTGVFSVRVHNPSVSRLVLDCFAKPMLWYYRGSTGQYSPRGAVCYVTVMTR